MAAIINADDGAISGASGLKLSSDTSGALNIQTNGVTAIAISASQAVSFPATTSLNFTSANITTLTSSSATITNLIATTASISDLSATVTRSASGTITNLLATSLTVSSGSTLNGGVVINEPGADVDFRVEGDTDANLIFADASADFVGIGTSTPATKLDVSGRAQFVNNGFNYVLVDSTASDSYFRLASAGTVKWYLRNNTANTNALEITPDAGSTTGLFLTQSGNLGLGVSPSAWVDITAIEIGPGGSHIGGYSASAIPNTYVGTNCFYDGNTSNWKYKVASSYRATRYTQASNGEHQWYYSAAGTAGNAITFTQAMTLDASGNLAIGSASVTSGSRLYVLGGKLNVSTGGTGAQIQVASWDVIGYSGASSNEADIGGITAGQYQTLKFWSAGSERARITSGGILGVGVTAPTGALSDAAGAQLGPTGWIIANRAANPALFVNRKTDDGDLVQFYQADTQEGSISVSGNTVSYNAFAGSHWSQLQDGSKPDILRGTVMESINELCVWPGEQNERLPKSKISDTAGSKKVYGVFMAWDNDWTETNDMYITAVGAFICRVNGSVTVQEGDLLESNGDGTARVQADDIIRSSTIGKVTSTVKTHQYDDGSYCVPTVLYCG